MRLRYTDDTRLSPANYETVTFKDGLNEFNGVKYIRYIGSATPGVDPFEFDFQPYGKPLTVGNSLYMDLGATLTAGILTGWIEYTEK